MVSSNELFGQFVTHASETSCRLYININIILHTTTFKKYGTAIIDHYYHHHHHHHY